MSALPANAERILRGRAFVFVAGVDPKGRPHVSPMWALLDDGRIVVNTAEGRVKDTYLQPGRDVTVSALDPDDAYRHIVVRGVVAERRSEGADAVIEALSQKYMGRPWTPQPGQRRVTITIEPRSTFVSG